MIAGALHGGGRRGRETEAQDFADADVALDPLSATDALLELCARLGKPSSAAQLCGALPLDHGEIVPRQHQWHRFEVVI